MHMYAYVYTVPHNGIYCICKFCSEVVNRRTYYPKSKKSTTTWLSCVQILRVFVSRKPR